MIQAADTGQHGPTTQSIRDLVLGMADGLTVPFALAAGVTGAVAASGLVVTAGLAEIVAGAISMGLGGYLAARTDAQHYAKEYAREIRETHEVPTEEMAEVAQILHGYGVREPILTRVVNDITSDREQWVEFMMRNELGLEQPDERAAPRSAVLVGGGYILGGIFPLAPYVFVSNAHEALWWSILCTSIALLVFGAVRARSQSRGARLGGIAGDIAHRRVQLGQRDRKLEGGFAHRTMVPWARANCNCMLQIAPMRSAMENNQNRPAMTTATPTAAEPISLTRPICGSWSVVSRSASFSIAVLSSSTTSTRTTAVISSMRRIVVMPISHASGKESASATSSSRTACSERIAKARPLRVLIVARHNRSNSYSPAATGIGVTLPARSCLSNSAIRKAMSIDCSALSRGSQTV